MIASPALAALDRIAARAQDLRDAFRGGAEPRHADVRGESRLFPSADPLSVAAPPGTWFLTRGPGGAAVYTRDGSFTIVDGVLRTGSGAAVLGFAGQTAGARGALPEPLRLPDADRALGRCDAVRIESDGSLAYARTAIDPRSGERSTERIVVGRVALARFPAGTQPLRINAAESAAPEGVVPHIGTAADGTFSSLASHTRDAGALDIDAAVRALSEAYIAFDALHAAQRARGGTDRTAMDLVK